MHSRQTYLAVSCMWVKLRWWQGTFHLGTIAQKVWKKSCSEVQEVSQNLTQFAGIVTDFDCRNDQNFKILHNSPPDSWPVCFRVAAIPLAHARPHRWPLGRSRSLKVTDFGPDYRSKARICDLLLVNDTNLYTISHHFRVIAAYAC